MSARKVVSSLAQTVLIATFALSAYAEERHTRKSKTVGDLLKRIETNTKKAKIEIKKSKSALPAFKKAALPERAKVNLTEIKPPSRSTLYFEEGTNERDLEKVTDEGIKQLYKLTQQFKNSKRRGELWIRLAEHYVEKARLIEYRLQQKHDDDMRQFQAGKVKTRPKLDLAAAQDYNRKAIQLYEWFLRDFPKDPKMDQALFFLGYNYMELNQPERGKDYYQRLTKEYPESAYIDESNFALGEYHFEREQWTDALKYYQLVAANKRARLHSFALYKSAWCLYKMGKVKDALVALERVIRSGRIAKGSQDTSAGGVSRIRLATEAQKDLVVFYAEAGTPEGARSYFTEVAGEKQTFNLLEKLAYYYSDTGNRDGARSIFRDLIAERPTAPKAYDYQYQIVTLYVSTERGEVFKNELYNWIQTYSTDSEWAKANHKDKELVTRASQLIETTLRNFILQQHQTAQNSKVPTAQKTAKQGYEMYFNTIKDGTKMDEMHFFFAELLFDMKDYEGAAAQYSWVAENAPNSQYFEKATLNTVLSTEKGLPKEEDLKKAVGESLDPVPLSPVIQAFETAVARYTKGFPKGESVPAMKYKMGALYYYHNQFDRALEAFNGIIKEYPKSQFAQYSANLTLDIYNLKKDYVGLEQAGKEILANENLANTSTGEQVKGILQRASFKKAQDLEAKKDYVGAAAAYEEFSKKNAGGELAAGASFNAAVNYERAGDLTKAANMYAIVLSDRNPKNEDIRQKASQFIAAIYEKTGQYLKAAQAFENYAAKNPKDKESAAFQYNAAVIRDGLNNYTQAQNNYQAYFDKSRSADRWEAVFLMAKLNERRGNSTRAMEYYKQYYEARPRNAAGLIESAYMVARYQTQKGKLNEAEEWYKKVIYQQKRLSTKENPVGVSAAAEAKYVLVSKINDELRHLRIPADPAKQQRAVKDKLALLERLKNQLKDVIAYDDAHYIVNSLALIGQAYQHMAASIYAVPLPGGLDAEGKKQYMLEVDKIARPFQDEAVKNYELAIDKGFKLEGYSDGLKVAERELNRIHKDKFPDHGERAVRAQMTDTMGVESDSDLGNAFKSKDETVLIDACAKRLGKQDTDLKALAALAAFYMEQGKLGLAKIIINRALKANPNEPGLHNNLGVIYLLEDKQRQAIGSLRRAQELKSGHAISAANLGSIFVEYKDYSKAVDLLKSGYSALRSNLKTPVAMDVANNYALALSGMGDTAKAKAVYEEILKANSSNVTALLNYTILLVYKLNDKKEGEKQLGRLRFLAEDARTKRVVEDLDKALNETK